MKARSATPEALKALRARDRFIATPMRALRAKGWKHWAWAALLIVIGESLSYFLDEREPFLSLRYISYQLFQNHGPREIKPRYTAVVSVDDKAYYHGDVPPASPIDRSLLATIISK